MSNEARPVRAEDAFDVAAVTAWLADACGLHLSGEPVVRQYAGGASNLTYLLRWPDRDLILRLARTHEALITIEEGAVGGFGSLVAQLLADEGVFDDGLRFRQMVLPDTFIDHASPEAMYRAAGMSASDIRDKVLEVLGVARLQGKRA